MMDKTRVDDMLIEMITPQVKTIEEKFSRGDGLTQTDIHTLLLKSQYNHINHLDQKMNEVTASVVALEGRFDRKFNELENKFDKKFLEFDKRFQSIEDKFQTFKTEIKLELEQSHVRLQDTLINTMKWYIGGAGVVLIVLKALDLFVIH